MSANLKLVENNEPFMKNENGKKIGFTQTPNWIEDGEFNIYQRAVLHFINRQTSGFHRKSHHESYSDIAKHCGMSRRKAIDTVKQLIKLGNIVVVRSSNGGKNIENTYALGSARQALGNRLVVHTVHHPSARHAPINGLYGAPYALAYIKENLLNKTLKKTPLPPKGKKVVSQKPKSKSSLSTSFIENQFTKLWEEMKFRKVSKEPSRKAFTRLCKTRWKTEDMVIKATAGIIDDIAERFTFVGEQDSPFVKMHLSSYLNKQGWLDEDMPQIFGGRK